MTAYVVVFGTLAALLAAWAWAALKLRCDDEFADMDASPEAALGWAALFNDPGTGQPPRLVPAARQAGREVAPDQATRRSEDSASLPRPKTPGPDRAGVPSAPVTTAPCAAAEYPAKGDSTGPGAFDGQPAGKDGNRGASGLAVGSREPAPPVAISVSRPGSVSEQLPVANKGHTGPGHHAAGPGQDAERATNRSITGPGRRWLRRPPAPVNFHTTALLQQACATAALLAYAETVLAGAAP